MTETSLEDRDVKPESRKSDLGSSWVGPDRPDSTWPVLPRPVPVGPVSVSTRVHSLRRVHPRRTQVLLSPGRYEPNEVELAGLYRNVGVTGVARRGRKVTGLHTICKVGFGLCPRTGRFSLILDTRWSSEVSSLGSHKDGTGFRGSFDGVPRKSWPRPRPWVDGLIKNLKNVPVPKWYTWTPTCSLLIRTIIEIVGNYGPVCLTEGENIQGPWESTGVNLGPSKK